MKASDYIVQYLIKKEITDVFGYPGGMVIHLMDSLRKYNDRIRAHVTYHEQAAAFAACGYAQASGKVGVAYATSGPGATNLITGICNAFFDSIPTVFITGQVNSFESRGEYSVRQRGFQETDIVSMVSGVTKYAVRVESAERLKWYLDYAFWTAKNGRPGPVLLDIPMDIYRAEINPDEMEGYSCQNEATDGEYPNIIDALQKSSRPVILVGNGVKQATAIEQLMLFLQKVRIPVVTTMLAVDLVTDANYGFIGAYGSRIANFIVAKSDLVLAIGARMDVRQVGARRENFAPDAKIIRIDIDSGELDYRVHQNEEQICANVKDVLKYLNRCDLFFKYDHWLDICNQIKTRLENMDDRLPNTITHMLGENIPDDTVITTDVGQNQVWVAQSLKIKKNQKVFFSGGHGAMGYSLPAAIGCALATGKHVISFSGDGGFQMNIQELQTIVREHLPISIVVFNNYSLGMIRHFQEMYFQDNFYQTVSDCGYTVPDFKAISEAYKIPYAAVDDLQNIKSDIFRHDGPRLIEVKLNEPTYVFPKLEFGKPNQDQEPLLDRNLYEELMNL